MLLEYLVSEAFSFLVHCAFGVWYITCFQVYKFFYNTYVNDLSCVSWQRDCGRPPVPRKDPGTKPEEEPLLSNHPYVDKVIRNTFTLYQNLAF